MELPPHVRELLSWNKTTRTQRENGRCVHERSSEPLFSQVCAPFLQNKKNLCPACAAKDVGEEQHWRTEGLVQEMLGFKCLICPTLGSQDAGHQGKTKQILHFLSY